MQPKFRFVTTKALDELEKELNLKERIPTWESVAGLSYTPANYKDIEQYISFYKTLKDEDLKFALMEMIIQAVVDQPNESLLINYWNKVRPILINDYTVHEWTIYYWKDMNEGNFENCKFLSPLIYELIDIMK